MTIAWTGKKFSKIIPFCESLTHLENVDSLFSPIQTAIYFRDFWWAQYSEFLNNILHKNSAEAFGEQYFLSEKRVCKIKSGAKLNNFDFRSNYFEKIAPDSQMLFFSWKHFTNTRQCFSKIQGIKSTPNKITTILKV